MNFWRNASKLWDVNNVDMVRNRTRAVTTVTALAAGEPDRVPQCVTSLTEVVEMGGIEPPSIAEILRLLRAQSVRTFYSAPTFVTNT